jgi:hypothetical protein
VYREEDQVRLPPPVPSRSTKFNHWPVKGTKRRCVVCSLRAKRSTSSYICRGAASHLVCLRVSRSVTRKQIFRTVWNGNEWWTNIKSVISMFIYLCWNRFRLIARLWKITEQCNFRYSNFLIYMQRIKGLFKVQRPCVCVVNVCAVGTKILDRYEHLRSPQLQTIFLHHAQNKHFVSGWKRNVQFYA